MNEFSWVGWELGEDWCEGGRWGEGAEVCADEGGQQMVIVGGCGWGWVKRGGCVKAKGRMGMKEGG